MHVLEQPLVLKLVLQYAGPDRWLFLGAISKTWAAMHEAAVPERPTRRQSDMRVHGRATSYAPVAFLLERVLYACASDAKLFKEKLLPLSKAAAAIGSSEVLMWVGLHGSSLQRAARHSASAAGCC
jgi:hypothetical protein